MTATPMIDDDFVTVHGGDCLEVLAAMPANSIDAVVTDPPYGLGNTTGAQVAETITHWVTGDRGFIPEGKGFMGRPWDAFVPPVAVWDEALRVLKPGGHLVAFSGSRTLDLMQLAIRLAGFDVRDTLMWLYGSGFPKGQRLDERMAAFEAGQAPENGIPPEVYTVTAYLRAARDAAGWSNRQIDALFGRNGMAGHWVSNGQQPAVPSLEEWARLKSELAPHLGDDVDGLVEQYAATNRPDDWGQRGESTFRDTLGDEYDRDRRTEWSTALKPAHEPIVLARKPVEGSTSRTVQVHGTGGLHVGACRVGSEAVPGRAQPLLGTKGDGVTGFGAGTGRNGDVSPAQVGRWPANVLLDDEAAAVLDAHTGNVGGGFGVRGRGGDVYKDGGYSATLKEVGQVVGYGDSGGASRFFYTAKASGRDRVKVDGQGHPTVKPVDLMRWLVRLVTPPGGTVLDPFAGSGTTLEAAIAEGFKAVGVEREPDYLRIIQARLDRPIERALDLGALL